MTQKEYLVRRLSEVPGVDVRVVHQHGERIIVNVGEITSANVADYFTALLALLKETREMLGHKACRLQCDFDAEVCRLLLIEESAILPSCHPYHSYRLRWDDGSLEEAAKRLPHVVADHLEFALMDDTSLTAVV